MRRKFLCALAALVLACSLCACGGTQVKADISAYGDVPITVTGATAKAGTVNPVGPTLETFLAAYGKTKEDLQRIRFYASDGYYVGFLPEALEKYEFILAVANGDDPLGESELPLRLVVVGGDSNQWVRMVERIECFLKE